MSGAIEIPVFGTKKYKGWPEHPDGGRAVYTTLARAMSFRYSTDAHFSTYSVPEIKRRLATPEVFAELPNGLPIVAFLVDVDAPPEHAPEGIATDEWWCSERPKLDRLLADHPALDRVSACFAVRFVVGASAQDLLRESFNYEP